MRIAITSADGTLLRYVDGPVTLTHDDEGCTMTFTVDDNLTITLPDEVAVKATQGLRPDFVIRDEVFDFKLADDKRDELLRHVRQVQVGQVRVKIGAILRPLLDGAWDDDELDGLVDTVLGLAACAAEGLPEIYSEEVASERRAQAAYARICQQLVSKPSLKEIGRQVHALFDNYRVERATWGDVAASARATDESDYVFSLSQEEDASWGMMSRMSAGSPRQTK